MIMTYDPLMTISAFLRKLFSPLLVGNCLGVMVALGILVAGSLSFLQCYTNHDRTVEVPNVRGLKLEDVRQKFEALGLQCEVADTGYVDTFVGDVVLEQSIRPGEQVKTGRIVELTINASSARAITLPNLAENCSRREAEAKLRALGFKYLRTEFILGDEDWVYSLKVNGEVVSSGTRVSVVTPVTLVVGDGHVYDEFNASDSLDYTYFPSLDESHDSLLEIGGGETDIQSEIGTEAFE